VTDLHLGCELQLLQQNGGSVCEQVMICHQHDQLQTVKISGYVDHGGFFCQGNLQPEEDEMKKKTKKD